MDKKVFYNPEALGLQVVRKSKRTFEVVVKCPYHHEKSSGGAFFNVAKGLFHCFSCGTDKNAEQIAIDLDGTIEKVEYDFIIDSREKEDITKFAVQPIALNNPYLAKRLVNNDLINKFSIREYNSSVIIPLKDNNGTILGFQERKTDNSFPKYIFHGDRPFLFPMNEVSNFLNSDKKIVFITEGIFGVLRIVGFGYDAFSILGSNNVMNAANFIEQCYILGKRVLLFLDNDEAGIRAMSKLLNYKSGICEVVFSDTPADSLTKEKLDDIINVSHPKNILEIIDKDKSFIEKLILKNYG